LAVDRLRIANLTWPAPLARRFPAGLLGLSDAANGESGWCAADNKHRFRHGAESINDEHCTSYS
jgi:hypothetical protein